ncbi:MAG: hypothetical protein ACLFWL_06660 [Candidatus Brocadiia bacterium]
MASIPDQGLFCWEDVENLGDLERLKLVLDVLPDEPLMRKMERERRKMVYWGYEKGRDAQKWRCPVARYSLSCEGYERCSGETEYGGVVRVSRKLDRRTFLPVARTSAKFERLYRKRTSVERVNSRLDVSFGFENHYIRGKKKMRARCSLALIVMLAMALGRVRENRSKGASEEDRTTPTVRSLVGAA